MRRRRRRTRAPTATVLRDRDRIAGANAETMPNWTVAAATASFVMLDPIVAKVALSLDQKKWRLLQSLAVSSPNPKSRIRCIGAVWSARERAREIARELA